MAINPLHPFAGRNSREDNLPSGPYQASLPSGYRENFNPNTVKSMGLRYPTVLVGWGYDMYGKPVPDNGESVNYSNFSAVKFSGGYPYPSGGMVNPINYTAGPLDVVFNRHTGCWQGDKSFPGKLVGSTVYSGTGPVYSSGSQILYAWREVTAFTVGGGTNLIDDSNPGISMSGAAQPNGSGLTSFAFNLAELERYPMDFFPVPIGTVVELHPVRTASGIFFWFNTAPKEFQLVTVNPTSTISANKWQYNAPTGTALNIVETNNTADFAAPGITIANLPDGFEVQPITDTVVKMYASGYGQCYFEAYNAVDGTCPSGT